MYTLFLNVIFSIFFSIPSLREVDILGCTRANTLGADSLVIPSGSMEVLRMAPSVVSVIFANSLKSHAPKKNAAEASETSIFLCVGDG